MKLNANISLWAIAGLSFAVPAMSLLCQKDNPKYYRDITRPILTSDILAIVASFQQATFKHVGGYSISDPLHVPKTQAAMFDFQTARVCIRDTNILYSTYMSYADIANVLLKFVHTCCNDGSGSCGGGSTDNLPTGGPELDIFIQNSSDAVDQCMGGLSVSTSTVVSWVSGGLGATGVVLGSYAVSLGVDAAETARIIELMEKEDWLALKYGGSGAVSALQAMRNEFTTDPRSLVNSLRAMLGVSNEEDDYKILQQSTQTVIQAIQDAKAASQAEINAIRNSFANMFAEEVAGGIEGGLDDI